MQRNCLPTCLALVPLFLATLLGAVMPVARSQPLLLYECSLTDYTLDGPGNLPHAIWLDIGTNTPKYVYDNQGGTIRLFSDSTIQITGRVINRDDSTWQWDSDIWLYKPLDYQTWTGLGRIVKPETAPPAVVAANVENWIFWEMDSSRSKMYGVPGSFFDGDTLILKHRPADISVGFQLGIAGNARNDEFGIGGWFFYEGDYTGHGDINVDILCDTPACDVFIDSAIATCVSDSTYELTVSFSGSNVLYNLTTNLGDTLNNLVPGTYVLGPYSDTDSVQVIVSDFLLTNCADTSDLIGIDCQPPMVCDVAIDTAYAECLNDSTFKVVLSVSGTGLYDIADDLGAFSASGPAGTFEFGPYANNTAVSFTATDQADSTCVAQVGPLSEDCQPPVVCDVAIDTAYAECLNDSTFKVVLSVSGTGNYDIADDLGAFSASGPAGTYEFGPYANNTAVSFTATDQADSTCVAQVGPLSEDCQPPVVCDVAIDTAYAECLNDSTFKVVLSVSGTGNYDIADDLGAFSASGPAGTYEFGPYANNTAVSFTATDQADSTCVAQVGPLSEDCQPPVVCDVAIDTAYAECLNDSTFKVVLSVSGTGNYDIADDLGAFSASGPAGTYEFGPYANNTAVSFTATDQADSTCVAQVGPLSEDCQPPVVCDVAIDTAYAECLNDSTFKVVLSVSGTGNYDIADDLGAFSASGPAGTYEFGPYANNTAVSFTATDQADSTCFAQVGPLSEDCQPPVVCDVAIDTAYAECLNDSTFKVVLSVSGTGNYDIADDLGAFSASGPAGTYEFGPYANNTAVSFTATDQADSTCVAQVGPLSEDCQPPVVCDVAFDMIVPQCVNDSSFKVFLTVSGSGNYDLTDDAGLYTASGGSGLYEFGPYANETSVSFFIVDQSDSTCVDSIGPVTENCSPPPTSCSLQMDTVYTLCVSDSTFEVVVSFTGQGSTYTIADDQGSLPLTGLTEGIYNLGPYLNSIDVIVTITDSAFANCDTTFGPVTADCTPVPICDLEIIDSLFVVNCINDSTFDVSLTFTGSGNDYSIIDNQGLYTLDSIPAGTYTFGPYTSPNTIGFFVFDNRIFGCVKSYSEIVECAPPLNNECIDAEPIACGSTIAGTTLNATDDGTLPLCGSLNQGPGVWYYLDGSGDMVSLTTCGSSDATFESEISVYKGSCGNFRCVTGNDKDPGCGEGGASVEFMANLGVRYYVYVRNTSPQGGTFSLRANCRSRLMPRLYPNPTKGEFELNFDNSQERMMSWSITNAQGQIVQQGRKVAPAGEVIEQYNLQGLPAGVYMFRCYLDWHPPVIQRIVLQK